MCSGPGCLGPNCLPMKSGKLDPEQLGPGARLSGAQLSALKKRQIGPRTVGALGPGCPGPNCLPLKSGKLGPGAQLSVAQLTGAQLSGGPICLEPGQAIEFVHISMYILFLLHVWVRNITCEEIIGSGVIFVWRTKTAKIERQSMDVWLAKLYHLFRERGSWT